jgi:hypothetical protein
MFETSISDANSVEKFSETSRSTPKWMQNYWQHERRIQYVDINESVCAGQLFQIKCIRFNYSLTFPQLWCNAQLSHVFTKLKKKFGTFL